MKTMIIAATVLAIIPIILALFLPNWYLGDTQNAVDEANLEGEVPKTKALELRKLSFVN